MARFAATNVSPQPGKHLADEPHRQTPSSVGSRPSSAPAHQAVAGEALPPEGQGSVVSKVAKLLINHPQDPRGEYPIRAEDGCLYRKVLMSLHAHRPHPL